MEKSHYNKNRILHKRGDLHTKRLTDEVIIAAVGGDEEAMSKVLAHYAPMIQKYSMGNEEMRQYIIKGLRESILHYDLNDPQKNEEYLRNKYSMSYGQASVGEGVQ